MRRSMTPSASRSCRRRDDDTESEYCTYAAWQHALFADDLGWCAMSVIVDWSLMMCHGLYDVSDAQNEKQLTSEGFEPPAF